MLPLWCFGTLLLSAVLGSPLRTNVTLESTSEPNSTFYPDDLENNKTARDLNRTQDIQMVMRLEPLPNSPDLLLIFHARHIAHALRHEEERYIETWRPQTPEKKQEMQTDFSSISNYDTDDYD